MRTIACLLLGVMLLPAAELPQVEDIPDPIGLGLRLALIDYLREELGVEPPAGADEQALVAFYEDLRGQRAGTARRDALAELQRRLWTEYGVAVPEGLDQAELEALLAAEERKTANELARQQAAGASADKTVPPPPRESPAPEAPPARRTTEAREGQASPAPSWQLPDGERPGFTRLTNDRIRLQDLDALRRSPSPRSLTAREIADRVRDGVVLVASPNTVGTGMVLDANGLILTCAHVIPPQSPLRVKAAVPSPGGSRLAVLVPARVIAIDRSRDLALLMAQTRNRLVPVSWADDTPPAMGDPLVVIGNPGLGEGVLEQTMTQGIVSNPAQVIGGQTFLQTTAAINPGNSGGPVFNERGAVIALMVLKGRDVEGINFAVPRATVLEFLRRCEEP